MAITNAGLAYIAEALIENPTRFDNANAHIGVGDGDLSVDVSQVNLQGVQNIRKGMDIGYPIRDGATLTFKSTFLPAEANFHWKEWGIFNGVSNGVMLARVTEDNSTKLSNQTWILEVDVSFVTSA